MASSKTLGFLREKEEQFRSSFVSERMSRLLDDFDNSSRRLDVALLEDEIRVAKRRKFMMMGTLKPYLRHLRYPTQ